MGWADALNVSVASVRDELPAFYTRRSLKGGVPGPATTFRPNASQPLLTRGAFAAAFHRFDTVVNETRLAAAIAAPNVSETMRLAPELAAPMDKWLDANGLERMQPIVAGVAAAFGYTHLYTTPAAYGLRFVTRCVSLARLSPCGDLH